MPVNAIGMVETRGMSGAIEAANVMLNSNDIRILGKEKIGDGFVTVFVEGEFEPVKKAVEAGADSVRKVGELISYNVIKDPHPQLKNLLPNK